MPLDDHLLSVLRSTSRDRWPAELRRAMADASEDVTGALFCTNGFPTAVVSASLAHLGACQATLGTLLSWAIWYRADQVVTFHTRLFADEWADPELEPEDLAFAERLQDLSQLFGGLKLLEHFVFHSAALRPLAVFGGRQPAPTSVKEMGAWRRTVQRTYPPAYRNPTTGDTWTGRGPTPPRWLSQCLAEGFELADFAVSWRPRVETGWGVVSGLGLFDGAGPILGADAFAPRPPMAEISYTGFEGKPSLESVARVLAAKLSTPQQPLAGLLMVAEDGGVVGPRAGIVGPETIVSEQPRELFISALLDGAERVVTFSVIPEHQRLDEKSTANWLRRLIFLGELLHLPPEDHLIVRPGAAWQSVRREKTWAWPAAPGLDDPIWPPVLRRHQRRRILRHPKTGATWDRRGTRPPWLEELLTDGWLEEELLVYNG